MNTKPYNTLWAVMSVDSKGNEGMCAIHTPIGAQLAVTGEQTVLDIYLQQIERGRKEVPNNLKIVVAEFKRSSTKELNL